MNAPATTAAGPMRRAADIVTELHLLVDALEAQAKLLRSTPGGDSSRWEDHRTEATAAVWEALDRIEPGLGERYIAALFEDGNRISRESEAAQNPGQQPNATTATHLPTPIEAAGCSAFER